MLDILKELAYNLENLVKNVFKNKTDIIIK